MAQGRFRQIRHTFPVTSHSFLPNDRDLGRTEVAKRKNERVYTPSQWMDIIRSARKRGPFNVIPVSQDLILNFSDHFTPFFKKVLNSSTKAPLSIQKARMLNYSIDHVNELWVKYTATEDEEWSILKARATPHLPPASARKYVNKIPLKINKITNIKESKYQPMTNLFTLLFLAILILLTMKLTRAMRDFYMPKTVLISMNVV